MATIGKALTRESDGRADIPVNWSYGLLDIGTYRTCRWVFLISLIEMDKKIISFSAMNFYLKAMKLNASITGKKKDLSAAWI